MKDKLKTRKFHSGLIEVQLIECVLLILIFALSYGIAWRVIYHNVQPFFVLNHHMQHLLITVLAIVVLICYKHLHFLNQSLSEVLKRIAAVGFLLNVLFIVILYFISFIRIAISYFITAYILQIVLSFVYKVIVDFLRRIIKQDNCNLVIIEDFSSNDLLKALRKDCKGELTVVNVENENLKAYMEQADNIYLFCSLTKELKSKIFSYCTFEGKRLYIVPEIFEITLRNSEVTFIGDIPVLTIEDFQLTESQRFAKRLADIVCSIIGIIVTLPITLLVSIGIKYEDKGPVLYKQERSGLNGRLFKVVKFRSMVVDAEKESGAVMAIENDQRITKIGTIMRSARIDEIPQFLNVLMGSMSLVGPRPERPVFVEKYNDKYPEYHLRQTVKPGITGLAQVKGNYTTSAENKLKFDLMYIKNYSMLLDIKILFQTVKVVFKREQAKGFHEKENRGFLHIAYSDNTELDRRLLQITKLYDQQ